MNVNEIKSYYQVDGKWKECEFLTGEEMAQQATELLRENKRLNNRIDKAIEYIEKYGKTIEEIAYQNGTCEDSLQEILDILKGSDTNV